MAARTTGSPLASSFKAASSLMKGRGWSVEERRARMASTARVRRWVRRLESMTWFHFLDKVSSSEMEVERESSFARRPERSVSTRDCTSCMNDLRREVDCWRSSFLCCRAESWFARSISEARRWV